MLNNVLNNNNNNLLLTFSWKAIKYHIVAYGSHCDKSPNSWAEKVNMS